MFDTMNDTVSCLFFQQGWNTVLCKYWILRGCRPWDNLWFLLFKIVMLMLMLMFCVLGMDWIWDRNKSFDSFVLGWVPPTHTHTGFTSYDLQCVGIYNWSPSTTLSRVSVSLGIGWRGESVCLTGCWKGAEWGAGSCLLARYCEGAVPKQSTHLLSAGTASFCSPLCLKTLIHSYYYVL